MFEKFFKTSCLAALVTAQRETILGEPMEIPSAKFGNTYNDGVMGEALYREGGTQSLISYITWRTNNDRVEFPAYSWIQSWAQWEDPENPGQYQSVTCNVGFEPKRRAARTVEVGNFYGDSIDANEVRNGKYDSYGVPIPELIAPPDLLWQSVLESEGDAAWEEAYGTTNSENSSSQLCTVWKPSWIQVNGVPPVPELNEIYHSLIKEYTSFETQTGFRMWNRAFHTDMQINENGGTFSFTPADWSSEGVVPYVPPKPEPKPDDDKKDDDDGMDDKDDGMDKDDKDDGMDDKDSDMDKDDGTMVDGDAKEDDGMMMIIIIVAAVAVVLILVVIIICCVIRASRNKKTPVELKEGGQQEMQVIDHETLE